MQIVRHTPLASSSTSKQVFRNTPVFDLAAAKGGRAEIEFEKFHLPLLEVGHRKSGKVAKSQFSSQSLLRRSTHHMSPVSTDYLDVDLSQFFDLRHDWIEQCDSPLEKWNSPNPGPPPDSHPPASPSTNPKKRPSPNASPTKSAEAQQTAQDAPLLSDDEEWVYTPPKSRARTTLSDNPGEAPAFTASTHEAHAKKVIELLKQLVGESAGEQLALLELSRHVLDSNASIATSSLFSFETVAGALNKRGLDVTLRDQLIEDLRLKLPRLVTQDEVATILKESRRSYSRHMRPQPTVASPPGQNGRPSIPILQTVVPATVKQAHLKQWALGRSAVRSGTRNFRSFRYSTMAEAYEEYTKDSGDQNGLLVSESRFGKLMRKWGIHTQKYDKYSCPKCHDEEKEAEHKKEVDAQTDAYQVHKKMVLEGKAAFLITDYTRIHELGTLKMRINGKVQSERMKLSCLGFILVAADTDKPGSLVYENFDFASARKQRTDFFEEAIEQLWDKLLPYINFDWERIFLWADGGMQTAGNLTVLAELQKSIASFCRENGAPRYPYLQANFFAPYHGHNVCDGHFGQLKIRTRQSLLRSPPVPRNAASGLAKGTTDPFRVYSRF